MSVNVRFHRVKNAAITALYCALTPAGLVALATQPGCFIFGSSGPSAVGQGKQYKSGDPTFDEFFATLYDLQVEMAKVPKAEKNIKNKLAAELKTEEDVSASLLVKKIGKLAKKLADAGVGLKLEVPKEPDEEESEEEDEEEGAAGSSAVDLKVSGRELQGDEKTFVKAVERAAQAGYKLMSKMDKRKRLLDKMRATGLALDSQIDATFRLGGPSKKSEVRKNMQDAQTLIPLMSARADEVGSSAKKFLNKLAKAVTTDEGEVAPAAPAAEEAPPAGDAAPEEPAKPKPKAGGRPTPPSQPAAPAQPPASDFEP